MPFLTQPRLLDSDKCETRKEGMDDKSVGIVTTARVTHATPGAVYAKTCHRDYESDTPPEDLTNYSKVKDIASQLVEDNHDLQVVLGGGRSMFLSSRGNRKDGKDLVKMWKDYQKAKGVNFTYVENNDQLKMVDPARTDYLFGLFNPSHMDFDVHRKETGPDSEPSLNDMVTKALKVLQKNDKGYFLLVEGGRIDHGHHLNLAHQALLETIAFDKAVASALRMTSEKDTLILVTADHSHVFSIAGYPHRGQSIVGTYYEGPSYPADGSPMTILQYTNGPGPQRQNMTGVDTTDPDYEFPNGVPTTFETHAGEDVAVFARGPMAHLYGAVQEQNVLGTIMGYAACMGPVNPECKEERAAMARESTRETQPSSGQRMTGSLILVAMVTLLASCLSQ